MGVVLDVRKAQAAKPHLVTINVLFYTKGEHP
jgi:hypothetical protein